MTEFLATVLASTSLALLLTAFAVQISGHQKLSLPIAVIAFGCLSFVTVWRNYLPRQLVNLRQTIAERDQTISGLKSDLAGQIRRTEEELRNREHDVEQWTASLGTIGAWLKPAAISFPAPDTLPAKATLDQRTKALINHIAAVTKASPINALPQPVLERLILLMDARRQGSLKRSRYIVDLIAASELVAGRRGTYFVIKPIDASNGQVIAFNERAYEWSGERDNVRGALADIYSDLFKDLERATPFEVFVLGHADALPFEVSWAGREEEGFQVLKHADSGYEATPHPYIFGSTLRNEDLPNLRARRMVSMLADFAIPREPLILDNRPVGDIGAQYRSVEIILFLPW